MSRAFEVADPPLLQVLLTEYGQRRDEIISFYERYDRQAQTMTLYLSILVFLAFFLLGISDPTTGGKVILFGNTFSIPTQIQDHASLFATAGLTIGALVAFFFISNLMEIVHVMHLLSARSAALERMINSNIESEILTWDSDLVPEFYGKQWRDVVFVGPSVLVGVWAFTLFLLIVAVLTYLSWILIGRLYWYWSVPMWVISAYHVAEWIWVISRRKNRMFAFASNAIRLFPAKPEQL